MALSDKEKQELKIASFQIYQTLALTVYLGDTPPGASVESFNQVATDSLVAAQVFRDAIEDDGFFDILDTIT